RSRVLTTASRKPVSTSSLGGTPLTFAVFLHQLLAHDLAHLGVGGRGEIEGSGSHSLHHPLAEPALLLGVLLSGQRARALGQPLAHHAVEDGGNVNLVITRGSLQPRLQLGAEAPTVGRGLAHPVHDVHVYCAATGRSTQAAGTRIELPYRRCVARRQ